MMKKLYLIIVMLLILAFSWSVALGTTALEQTVLTDMINKLSGLPGDWSLSNIALACDPATPTWTGLSCDISNTIIGIDLAGQGIIGNIPSSFTGTALANVATLDVSNNGLYTTFTAVDSYITGKQSDWKDTQVAPPLSISASPIGFDAIQVLWNTDYGSNLISGPTYSVYNSVISGSNYSLGGQVTGFNGLAISGLPSDQTFFFVVNTTGTNTSGALTSDRSPEVSATTGIPTGTGSNTEDASSSTKEACYIATAAYGSYLDPHVQALRDFRDNVLLKSAVGRELVELYYRTSPPLAEYIREHEGARTLSRIALTPVVFGVAFPGLIFAMAFGMGILGGVWMRKRRGRKERTY